MLPEPGVGVLAAVAAGLVGRLRCWGVRRGLGWVDGGRHGSAGGRCAVVG